MEHCSSLNPAHIPEEQRHRTPSPQRGGRRQDGAHPDLNTDGPGHTHSPPAAWSSTKKPQAREAPTTPSKCSSPAQQHILRGGGPRSMPSFPMSLEKPSCSAPHKAPSVPPLSKGLPPGVLPLHPMSLSSGITRSLLSRFSKPLHAADTKGHIPQEMLDWMLASAAAMPHRSVPAPQLKSLREPLLKLTLSTRPTRRHDGSSVSWPRRASNHSSESGCGKPQQSSNSAGTQERLPQQRRPAAPGMFAPGMLPPGLHAFPPLPPNGHHGHPPSGFPIGVSNSQPRSQRTARLVDRGEESNQLRLVSCRRFGFATHRREPGP